MTYPLGNIHAFDFDGTLTRRDTLLEIMRFHLGWQRFLLVMLRYLPLIVLMKAGIFSSHEVKQLVFTRCFGGMSVEQFNALCRRFATERASLMRPAGVKKIQELLAQGERVVIITASITNWVEPFFSAMPEVTVLGTIAAERDGRLTGRFATKNCRGKEKINRLLQLYPERKQYHLTVYGDSSGDRPLLDFADAGSYRPFR